MQDGLKRVLDYSDYLAAPEDGNRYGLATTDTHAGDASLTSRASQARQQRHQDACAGGPDRMPQGHGASVDV